MSTVTPLPSAAPACACGDCPSCRFSAFYAAQFARKVSTARRLLGGMAGDSEAARDVAQAAFLDLWRHWHELDGQPLEVRSRYLTVTVRNRVIDALRRRRYGPHVALSLDIPHTDRSGRRARYEEILPDGDAFADPAGVAEGKETAREYVDVVCRVPDDYTLLERRLAGVTAADVARELERSESALKMAYSRMLHRWRTHVEHMEHDNSTGGDAA